MAGALENDGVLAGNPYDFDETDIATRLNSSTHELTACTHTFEDVREAAPHVAREWRIG